MGVCPHKEVLAPVRVGLKEALIHMTVIQISLQPLLSSVAPVHTRLSFFLFLSLTSFSLTCSIVLCLKPHHCILHCLLSAFNRSVRTFPGLKAQSHVCISRNQYIITLLCWTSFVVFGLLLCCGDSGVHYHLNIHISVGML